ncbi:MAG: ChaN family lipoprotein [Bdellovibrionales bacterium]|nr:ChaN family lipoprotein [Bdellovibrionales bacterium]
MLFGVLVMSFLTVRAQEIPLRDGSQPQTFVNLQQIASQVRPGTIIVMGENHGFKTAQQGQIELMQALRMQGLKVSTGLEFFYYPDQDLVDSYRAGSLSEADFLQKIQWGSPAYDFYRDQALFPRYEIGERTLALNAPRSLTGRISKVGIAGLTPDELQLLPPNFQVGRASYKERFLAMMPHLPSPEAGERYFEAQSTWDDTMAWKAAEFIKAHPDQVLVITVGDFHAMYGGGLPDRIASRTQQKPLVFSYVNVRGMTADEIEQELDPSTVYGPRADYIWVTEE